MPDRHEKFSTPSGREIEVVQDDGITGAWLHLDGRDRSLTLQVNTTMPGGAVQTYVGYRDGVAMADKLAISVDEADRVLIQFVIGKDDVRTFSLVEFEAMVATHGGGKAGV